MSKLARRPAPESGDAIKRWPTLRSKAWTLQFLTEARDSDNIIAIVAVGSAVRSDVPSVDLDLVVICRDSVNLNPKPPIEIDLRAYRADHVHEQIAKGNDLLGWTVKFGRVLFQRDSYWDCVLESWRNRLPLPAADVAVQRATQAFDRLINVFELSDLDAADEQAVSYVTHLARAELLKRDVYPASRPELPAQLRKIGSFELADRLDQLIDPETDHSTEIARLVEGYPTRDRGSGRVRVARTSSKPR